MNKSTIFLLLVLSYLNFSCIHKKNSTNFSFKTGIFIANEGNFTYENASISFLDYETDSVYNDIFFQKNNFNLGDVVQSIFIWKNKAYIIVNNSSKIVVIDNSSIEYLKTIKGLSSPRYMILVDSQKAYVSDLYSQYITIINLLKDEISGFIKVGRSTEKMIKWYNYVFVVSWSFSDKLYKIDINNDIVVDSLTVGMQPNSLVIDKNNNIWILCDGGNYLDTSQNQIPKLYCVNPYNLEIIKTIDVGNRRNSPHHLCINKNGDTLYFIINSWNNQTSNAGIYKISINDSLLPKNPFIKQGNNKFYSLYLTSTNIYVSDAIDFLQKGVILKFDYKGKLLKKYRADIIPGEMIEKAP